MSDIENRTKAKMKNDKPTLRREIFNYQSPYGPLFVQFLSSFTDGFGKEWANVIVTEPKYNFREGQEIMVRMIRLKKVQGVR